MEQKNRTKKHTRRLPHITNDRNKDSWMSPSVVVAMSALVVAVISIPWWSYLFEKERSTTNGDLSHISSNSFLAINERVPPLRIEDLLNVKIPYFIDDSRTVALSSGLFETFEENEYGAFSTYIELLTAENTFTEIDYNGDGNSDIIAFLRWSGGGSGQFYNIALFENVDGFPVYRHSDILGDRIMLNSVTSTGTVVMISYLTQGPDEGRCCASTPATSTFDVYNDRFVHLDTEVEGESIKSQ